MNTNTDSPLPQGKKSVVIAPPTQKRRRPLHFEPLFLIPYLLSAAVALFWPEEGWRNSFVDTVADFFVNHIPSVNAYVRKSVYPEVMRAYFALTFFIFIPTLILFIMDRDALYKIDFQTHLENVRKSKHPSLFALFGIIACLSICYFVYKQTGYQYQFIPMQKKRWALAVLGPAVGWLVFYMLLTTAYRQYQLITHLIIKKESKNGME